MSPRAMQVALDIKENLGPEDENRRKVGSFWQPSAHSVNVMIDGWYKKQVELRLESDLGVNRRGSYWGDIARAAGGPLFSSVEEPSISLSL